MDNDMQGRILVSVVMATYNEPSQIVQAAIKSVLGQTISELELLIYDDSTEESTKEAIDFFQNDDRLHVFRGEKRVGFVPALNMGLRQARGKFIARMDGDDISYPDRFEKEISFLETHPDVYVVGGQINIINECGEVISSRRYPKSGMMLDLYAGIRSPLAHPAIMMRREIVEAGFVYDESLKMSEDLDLWLRIMNYGYKIANVGDVVLDYRVNGRFINKRTNRRQIEYMANVRKKNTSRRYPVRSFLSWSVANLFLNMPVKIIQEAYKIENRQ